jgi:hypothetical protein
VQAKSRIKAALDNRKAIRQQESNHMKTLAMKTFITGLVLAGFVVAFAGAANAQMMTGSMGVAADPFVTFTGSWTASSLTMSAINLITTSEQGTFLALVPSHSDLTAYTTTITGLSTSPTAENIPDFFVFSTPDVTFATSGTTPNNRFEFNLATITDVGGGVFTGTGTLVDTTAAYANTPGIFTLSFPDDVYSFTIAAVPEPSSLCLLIGGLGLLVWTNHARRRNLPIKPSQRGY